MNGEARFVVVRVEGQEVVLGEWQCVPGPQERHHCQYDRGPGSTRLSIPAEQRGCGFQQVLLPRSGEGFLPRGPPPVAGRRRVESRPVSPQSVQGPQQCVAGGRWGHGLEVRRPRGHPR